MVPSWYYNKSHLWNETSLAEGRLAGQRNWILSEALAPVAQVCPKRSYLWVWGFMSQHIFFNCYVTLSWIFYYLQAQYSN